MAFNTPDFQAIRDGILRDIANQPRTDGQLANVALDGDYAIRANATASSIEGLYQHQQWIVRQIFPDTADLEYLQKAASLKYLTQKNATYAAGSATFYGTPGAIMPVGAEAKSPDGLAFVTTASVTFGSTGSAAVAIQASAAGAAGNLAAGTQLILTAAPSGVQSQATVISLSGGTDQETPISLLSRLLFVYRNPPMGGAGYDYYTWAMDVSGVTAAYVYPKRRGLGSVDVVILTAGGLPDPTLVSAVQAALDTKVVRADILALAPTGVTVNITATLTLAAGYSLATVSVAVQATLAAYFSSLAPGDTVYLHRIESIISNTPGVVDFVLSTPTANTSCLVDSTHVEIGVLGAVTLS